MAVVVVVEGVGADRFTVATPPSAELAAALHVLGEPEHHAPHAGWAAGIVAAAPASFRTGLRRFAPLWTALRWRGFYPGDDDSLSLDRFAEFTAYSCVSGYHGFDFARLLHEPAQAATLGRVSARLPESHHRLAEDLLRDPAGLRAELTGFLDLCRPVFFDALWRAVEPALVQAADRVRRVLADAGPAAALRSLSPSSSSAADPDRVVFDKVHHAVISPARTRVILIPTWYGAPHLLVKNEPGRPAVIHFPVPAPEVGVTLARARMLALTDPRRVRLARLIARQAMTTADLADRLAMTRPQVSRHLRVLRDLGLVRAERDGRNVLYRLDLDAVARIGVDAATALQH